MDIETQKMSALRLLRAKPMSTFDFRNAGICHPAARVQELRKAGHRIDTVLGDGMPDHRGNMHHSVAKYVLVQEAAR